MKSILAQLHSKYAAKTWNETFQLVRRCTEQPRQPPLPSLERLQEAFNGSCVYTTRCRLEAVAKEQGMGFHFSEATCYLTAELFYLEVALLPCGGVDDVKVAPHGGAPVSSESLLRPLSSKDFAEFSAELRDLVSQYDFPGENQVKFNLFTALQHLAKDMRAMLQLARAGNDGSPRTDTPNDGLLGCLIAGEADRPLTVQFYALPSADANFGETQAAQVAVVSSDVMHKLQMAPVVQPPLRLDPEGFPVSSSTSEVPHEMFPACFALRLRPAVPVLTTFVDKIKQITDVAVPDVELQWAQFPTLLPRGSKGFQSPEEHQDRIFTVPLPGDTPHVYVFPGAAWNAARHAGTLTDCVRFTGPAHVPRLLEVLRHQCAINALLRSCTSPAPDCERRFEVRPEGDDGFSVTFQWPNTDSLALLLVNIPDSHQITCRLYVAGIGESSLGEFVSAVMKRSMSVPVTLQMLYRKIESAAAAPADSEKVPSTPPRVATDDPSSASQTSARRLPDVGVGPAPDAPAAVSPDWLTTNGQP